MPHKYFLNSEGLNFTLFSWCHLRETIANSAEIQYGSAVSQLHHLGNRDTGFCEAPSLLGEMDVRPPAHRGLCDTPRRTGFPSAEVSQPSAGHSLPSPGMLVAGDQNHSVHMVLHCSVHHHQISEEGTTKGKVSRCHRVVVKVRAQSQGHI